MKCPSFEELMAFSDSELGREDASRVEAHIATCPRCASLYSSQKRMECAWRDSYREPSSDHFEMLERTIRSRYPVQRRSALRWAVPIAAALLVAIAGMKFLGRNGRLARETGPAVPPDAGFSGELTADGTIMQTEEVVSNLDSAVLTTEQEQMPEWPAPETGVAAAPETVVVTGTVDEDQNLSRSGTAGWDGPEEYGDLLEIGTIEAQVEGSHIGGAEQAAAGYQQSLTVDQQAPSGGGGAALAGGEGGLSGGEFAGSSGLAGDMAADADAFELCATEELEEQAAVPEDAAGLMIVQTCGECPSCARTAGSSADTTLRDEADLETRGRLAVRRFLLFFDAEGIPSSPDTAVLDEAFPGWKDSLHAFCSDSMLVVSADEISEMMVE